MQDSAAAVAAYQQSFGTITGMAGDIETANSGIINQYRLLESLPFTRVMILGKEYTHLNTRDSVLDQQFVRMTNGVENEYKDILRSR